LIDKRFLLKSLICFINFNKIDNLREKINNPSPINRLNKRRQYDSDKRRNVTFTLREDLSYLIDDLCDSAKVYKGQFADELLMLGVEEYIKRYGVKMRKFK